MNAQTTFHFKAATGDGAVINGKVASASAKQVTRDLMMQGLIPVHVTPERRNWTELLSLENLSRFLPKSSAPK